MTLIILTILFTLLFAVSVFIEPRRFRNGIYLTFMIIFGGLWLLYSTDSAGGIGTIITVIIVLLVPVTMVIISILLIINGFVVSKKEGFSKTAMLSPLIGLTILLYLTLVTVCLCFPYVPTWLVIGMFFAVLELCYVGFTLVAFFIYSLFYCALPKRIRCDYIIVNGAGLLDGNRVSPLLAGRLNKAIKIYNKSKSKSKLLVSGGQGGDETESEAAAMKKYLITMGIPKGDIIVENKSTTTYENLKFSKEILDNINKGNKYTCIFVTSNYHVFRTSMFAKKLKLKAQGVGCKTAAYYWPSAFLREYVATFVHYKWGFFIWSVLMLSFIILSYLPI